MAKSQEVKDFINLLDEIHEKDIYPIWIPSLNKEAQFKHLSTEHQKNLVRAILDSQYFQTSLNLAIFNIIVETIVDKDLLSELTVIDKNWILLSLRAYNVSPTYKVPIEDDVEHDVDLFKHLEKKKKGFKMPPNPIKVKDGNIEVFIKLPTINLEQEYEKNSFEIVKTIKGEDLPRIKDMIAVLYISTISQYISAIIFHDKEQVLDFTNLDVNTRYEITSKLSNSLSNEIKKAINIMTKANDIVTTVDFKTNGKSYSETIQVNQSFFDSE